MTFGGIPQWIILPWLFAFGACIGSFLNVCIYRIPQHERLWDQLRGLTHPPSSCPFCRRRILAIDNIPVFGWLILWGRCRFCRHTIPPRYALIEFFNGLLWVMLYMLIVPAGFQATVKDSCLWSPLSPLADPALSFPQQVFWLHAQYFYFLVLVEALLVATFIDFDLYVIPDGSTVPAMIVGVLGACVLGHLHPWPVWFQCQTTQGFFQQMLPDAWIWARDCGPPAWLIAHPHLHGLLSSLAGIIVGGGIVWLVRIIGERVMRRETMGFGDVILMAMIGSFLGWQATIIVFFVAPFCSLVVIGATLLFGLVQVAVSAGRRCFSRPLSPGFVGERVRVRGFSWAAMRLELGLLLQRVREIAYGPYLSIAALLVLLFWNVRFSKFEQYFCLGPVVFVHGVFMIGMLALTLMFVQYVKRLLGFVDLDEPPWEWSSGDQLAYYASKDAASVSSPLQPPTWPGTSAGQGRQFTDRWRSSGR